MREIRNLIIAELSAEIFILAVSVVVAISANTSTIGIMAAIYGASFLSGLASLYAVRAAMKGNEYQFPYGTGRLENACAFAYGVLLSLCAARTLVVVATELFGGGEIPEPNLNLATIPVALSLVANSTFFFVMKKMIRRSTSQTPVFDSYYIMYSTATIRDAVLLASVVVGSILVRHWSVNPAVVDRVLCSAVSVYILVKAVPHVIVNFRALVDYPLPEETQLKILRVLAKHTKAYDSLGRIFNTQRGNTNVIEFELGFQKDVTIEQLQALQDTMQKDMKELMPNVHFRIVPVSRNSIV